jgi:hypothetical protein
MGDHNQEEQLREQGRRSGRGSQHHWEGDHADQEREAPAEAKCESGDTHWALANGGEPVVHEPLGTKIARFPGEGSDATRQLDREEHRADHKLRMVGEDVARYSEGH